MVMQGYDKQKALTFIMKSMSADGIRMDQQVLTDFIGKAIQAHFDYMLDADVLDEDGWSSDGDYDEDDAFEYMLNRLTEGIRDDSMIDKNAQLLDSFLQAQEAFLEEEQLSE